VLIDVLRVTACAVVLLYACRCDWRTRRVRNQVWYPLLGAGVVLALLDWGQGDTYLPADLLLSMAFTTVFAYLLFRLRLFGGADAKALMVLSVVLPQYPLFFIGGTTLPLLDLHLGLLPLFAFTTLTNAVLLTAVLPIGLFLQNIARHGPAGLRGKLGLALLGYPLHVDRLPRRHVGLLHTYENDGDGVRVRFSRHSEEVDRAVAGRLKKWHEQGLIPAEIWVTPQLPFIIPLTIGFLTALLVGDLMLNFMAWILW